MDHDAGYHLLFGHPRLVADLLRGFVDEAWVAELDFDSLKRVNAKFHADGLERRDGDVIWKVKRRDGQEAYLYIALEFQSSSDRWMALRVAIYVLLLYDHLIREKKIGKDELLPPVYPFVIYNGEDAWTAKLDLRDLIASGPDGRPWPWRPRFRYHLLDEQRYNGSENHSPDNLVAILIQLEQCRTVEDLQVQVRRLIELLPGEGNALLRRSFTTVLKQVLAPARGVDLGAGEIKELSEVNEMLANRVKEWQQNWLDQGIQQGIEKGRAQGEALALIRLLEKKFGPLDDDHRERIMSATAAEIEAWLDRLMEATTLAAVFSDRSVN